MTLKQFHQMMGHRNQDDMTSESCKIYVRALRLNALRIGSFVMCALRASKLMQPSIPPLTIVPMLHNKWFIQIWQVQLPQLQRAVSGMPYVLWMIILDLCPTIP